MMKRHRAVVTGKQSVLPKLSAVLLTLFALSACAEKEVPDDVAVASMPIEKVQTSDFLPLNDDKPGTYVTIQRYFVPGKYNVIQYFSPNDGASAEIIPRLAQLTQARKDIAVRTVNVNRPEVVEGIDWQSPVLENSAVRTLPYFQIYDPSGSLRAQARPAYEQVMQWIQNR